MACPAIAAGVYPAVGHDSGAARDRAEPPSCAQLPSHLPTSERMPMIELVILEPDLMTQPSPMMDMLTSASTICVCACTRVRAGVSASGRVKHREKRQWGCVAAGAMATRTAAGEAGGKRRPLALEGGRKRDMV